MTEARSAEPGKGLEWSNDNIFLINKIRSIKRFLVCCVMVVMGVVSGFAQGGVDFATYDVLVRRGDVAVVAKGEDYRMVVGNLKKPKTVFLLGKSKEEAARKIDQLVEVTAKCPKDKASRSFLFCGILLYYSAAGSDSNLQYSFQREDNKVKFVLNRDDLLAFKQVYDDK